MKDLINSFKENIVILFLLTVSSICLIFILYNMYALPEFANLKLNEKGDFIAGILSPLGFIWLIYGYIQQGQELKLNTEALTLQAEELSNSVEQQKELVKATREELDIIKRQSSEQYIKELVQRQPFFHFPNISVSRTLPRGYESTTLIPEDVIYEKMKVTISVFNSRSIARDIEITVHNHEEIVFLKNILTMNSDENEVFTFVLPYQNCFREGLFSGQIHIRYLDQLDEFHYQIYNIQIKKIEAGTVEAKEYINRTFPIYEEKPYMLKGPFFESTVKLFNKSY